MSSQTYIDRPDFDETDNSIDGLRYKRDRQIAIARGERARGYRYSGYVSPARYYNRLILSLKTGRPLNIEGYRL